MKKHKKLFGILLLIFLIPSHALAQGSEPPLPPAPTGGNIVLDTLDWLTPSQESEINSINKKLDEDGIAQIAVVTLDDCGGDKQKFRNDLFRTWGIGHANDNDGLLILVCWYGGDQSRRSVEQETGFGLEGALPDVLTGRVAAEEFVPAFKTNQPGNGLVAMVNRYNGILRQNPEQSNPVSIVTPASMPMETYAYLLIGVLGIFPGLILATAYVNIRKQKTQLATRVKKGRKSIVRKNQLWGITLPTLKQFTLAEIVSLVPILVILYAATESTQLPQAVRGFSQIMVEPLFYWLIFLVVSYFQDFFGRTGGGNWSSRNDSWGSSNDSSSRDSFGGGSSGGGGSSSKF